MKIYLPIITFIAFFLLAAFGFMMMGHSEMAHCIASVVQGSACPQNDFLGFVSFHVGFFKVFSSAFFNSLVLIILLFTLVYFTVFAGRLFFDEKILKLVLSERGGGGDASPSEEKTRNWLSFLENSPSFVPAFG